MNVNVKQLYLLFNLLITAGYSTMNAQMITTPEPLRPSTDVWETIKYGEIKPSLYTGTVNVTIPFYSYKDADFEIPISFVYASNGLQPNARAGSMGMGWRLSVGGCISREIKGVPDDTYGLLDAGTGSYRTLWGFSFLPESGITPSISNLYAYGSLGPINAQCFYTNYNRTTFIDAEPDIFHFDFMGHSGSFMLDQDGYIHVFDTNDNPNSIKVEYNITYDLHKCDFSITTGDAYRYEFFGQAGSAGHNYDYSNIDGVYYYFAWHLARIVAPNGRTVEFSYDEGPNVVSYRPSTLRYQVSGDFWTGENETRTSGTTEQVSGIHAANIVKISVDGSTLATFSYANTTEKVQSTVSQTGSSDSFGNKVLTGIIISYGNNTLRSCNMTYTYSNNPGQRRFLTALTIFGEGTYSMDYESPGNVPMYKTFKVDHWDYYNNRYNANASSFLDISTLSSNGMEETYNVNNAREPSFLPSKYGILTRITYPTGGYSSFTYEGHDYSLALLRSFGSAFEPELVSESGKAGGVRIKTVENHSASGSVLSRKTYIYSKNGISTGILLNKPRYRATFHFDWVRDNIYSTGLREPESSNVAVKSMPIDSPSRSSGYRNVAYIRSNNLTRYNSTHIEYTDVTETSLDGSSTTYSFTSSLQYPDTIESDDILSQRAPGDYSPAADISWVVDDSPSRLFFLTSAQSLRGRILGVKQKAGSTTVASITTTYAEILPGAVNTSDGMYTYLPVSSPGSIEMIGVYTGRTDVTSRSSAQHFGDVSVCSTEVITYNAWCQPSEITVTDSRGLKTRTKRQYVTDDLTGMNATVFGCGIVDAPISERNYEVDSSGGETLLSRTTWTYTRPDATNHPNLVRVSSVIVKDERENKNLYTNYSYDSYGHLLQKMDPNTVFTTYIWGYGGMYPVAEIHGITLSQVRSISGLSGINTNPLPGSVAAYESALRAIPNAQVTTYEYAPLLGLTKVTGPDGRSESYSYNASGKLRHVLDDLMERVSSHYYSFDQESFAVNANN